MRMDIKAVRSVRTRSQGGLPKRNRVLFRSQPPPAIFCAAANAKDVARSKMDITPGLDKLLSVFDFEQCSCWLHRDVNWGHRLRLQDE